jgi:hypothetical protein
MQRIYCPVDFCFSWDAGWYTWDRKEGQAAARQARNAEVKRLRKEGWEVSTFSLPGQLVTRGGIGSGHPEVEFHVTGYGFNVFNVCG